MKKGYRGNNQPYSKSLHHIINSVLKCFAIIIQSTLELTESRLYLNIVGEIYYILFMLFYMSFIYHMKNQIDKQGGIFFINVNVRVSLRTSQLISVIIDKQTQNLTS